MKPLNIKPSRSLEERVEEIEDKLNMLNGAWLLIKVLGSIAIGFTMIYSFIKQYILFR